jgi:hypothetical protein
MPPIGASANPASRTRHPGRDYTVAHNKITKGTFDRDR